MRRWILTHVDDLLALAGGCAIVRGLAYWSPALAWLGAGVTCLVLARAWSSLRAS